ARGAIEHGRDGDVRWAADADWCFGAVEVAESDWADVADASRAAYAQLAAFVAGSRWPHLVRVWNYLADINAGDGDDERYKHFCTGRAAGMTPLSGMAFPAASAIGRSDGVATLQVYWLASREPGRPIENPRQTSAWRYPRQYGPTAPTFARAMRAPGLAPHMYISGTAAVVGHASQHDGDVGAQLSETFANLDSLVASAALPPFGAGSVLKVYVRHAADVPAVTAGLERRLPADAQRLVLIGDICRLELLVEIDGLHAAP
ncbi:MAG TPA: pteridine-dependent deoxygenase, partial [Tahibacter sp.]|nr:pteridine-dependent deoxygenase [Tahibacter sp.]